MLNPGDTAWVLASAALVMLMTPGLAFFYGGMVRSRSVLNMLMMSFISLAVISVLWMVYGYSLAFADDAFAGLIGNLDHLGLGGTLGAESGTIPTLVFVMFQLMFAIITTALISGAVADRTKFWSWVLFAIVWATVVYFPVAHWVFSFSNDETGFVGGWIANNLGALDFAGGTAVHINSGAAALALALVLGRRRGWPKDAPRPHNLPLVLLGAALLWFGWYGFNAGSALAANQTAAVAFTTTTVATASAVLGWVLVEQAKFGKPTLLGAASGAVAGLVAITPACGFVNPLGALCIGLAAGAVCALAVSLKFRLRYDDSLDVVGIHLVGGLLGTLLIGLFATTSANEAGANGLFYGGGLDQLGKQAVAAAAVMGYSFVLTLAIGLLIKHTIGFRVDAEAEATGIDEAEHKETAYELAGFTGGGGSIGDSRPPVKPAAATPGKLEGSKA